MKKLIAVSVFAVSLGANAVTDWNVSYFPTTETGPWSWTVEAGWIRNWSPWAHTVLNGLPRYDDTIGHTVNLYHNKLATAPLVLSSGTSATINGFTIGGGKMEEPGIGTTNPVKFEIDGGSLTVNSASYIGYSVTNTIRRSGQMTIKNGGTLTTKGDFNLGHGYADSALTIENGTFTAHKTINVGSGLNARGFLTNGVNGVIITPNISLASGSYSTGIVYNAGTMTAGIVQLGVMGGKSVSRFDNDGTLTVTNYFRLGISQYAAETVYVHHKNAKLVRNGDMRECYIGYNGPGRMVIDGGKYEDKDGTGRFFFGYKNYAGRGALDVINGGTFYNKDRVAFGYANYGEGTLTVSNNSSFQVNNAFYLGNALGLWSTQMNGRGVALVDDHSVMQFGQLRAGDAPGAYGELTVSGGSIVRSAYSGTQIYAGASTAGGSTGVVSVVGADSVISNFTVIGVASVTNGNNGTLMLKGGTVSCMGNNAESLVLGCQASNTTVANRSTAIIRGYGTIQRADPTNYLKCAYMKHHGKVIADGEGVERDLDMHTMCSLLKGSIDSAEIVNLTGDDGWYAVNKGRLRLPHGERIFDYRQRGIGDTAWLSDQKPRLVNSIKIAFEGAAIGTGSGGEGPCYFHVDLYAPDRSDIPAGFTDRFDQDEITAVYRMGCFKDVHDDSDGHVLNYPTITFHYAKPGYEGYEDRNVKLYWYNEATSTWKLEKVAAFDAESPFITTVNTHPGASGKAWNLGWYAVAVPKRKGMLLILK